MHRPAFVAGRRRDGDRAETSEKPMGKGFSVGFSDVSESPEQKGPGRQAALTGMAGADYQVEGEKECIRVLVWN